MVMRMVMGVGTIPGSRGCDHGDVFGALRGLIDVAGLVRM